MLSDLAFIAQGLPVEALGAAALGVLLHLTVFIKGEWHLEAPMLLIAWITTAATLFSTSILMRGLTSYEAFKNTSLLLGSFTGALFTSVVIYRTLFHRLRGFPGPPLAKVSKLWHAYQCLDSKQYKLLEELRQQYGDFVRTGPTELYVARGDIFDVLDGPKNTCEKANWYDILRPALAIISVRDKKTHDRRRRIWDRALNAKSLVEYRPRLLTHVDKLLERVSEAATSRSTVRINDLIGWYAFDSMGDFAFGKSFGMLDMGRWHDATAQLRRGMSMLGPMSSIPWAAIIGLRLLPGLWRMAEFLRMKSYCVEQMRQRMERKDVQGDISKEFIRVARENGLTPDDRLWLDGDAMTVIIGGSETTASTLTFIIYHFALDLALQERVFNEIKGINRDDSLALRNCELLNAVISETLRLHPALPSAVYRQTPPEGVMLGDTYLPGNVNILAPRWVISRLESCFAEPLSFIPERWTTRPELVRYGKSFNPFGMGKSNPINLAVYSTNVSILGRYSCAGKQVATEEMLFVCAGIIQNYRVYMAPGETGARIERDMKDQLSAVPGALDLRFEKREDA